MRFISTRGESTAQNFSDVVAMGLAPDGGLFLPEALPDFSGDIPRFSQLSYPALAADFLGRFATDIPAAELQAMCRDAYARFAGSEIAPLRQLGPKLYALELFHGPTLAFKDFALQLLGGLYARQCRVRGESINVLGATSGDTGAAAIHGLGRQEGTAIFILYPDGKVSPLQERQMTCTGAANVFALACTGSFDDAQSAMKTIFGDQEFRVRQRLSAVNSINLARILAQCVYYLWAWLRLPEGARANLEFVVPTGNFGNVLAGWMLQKMGVPIPSFRVATNRNDILHRFFSSREYRAALVEPSLAPSMDIQVASNFERFLYYYVGGNAARVREYLGNFQGTGRFLMENFERGLFRSSRCSDAEIPQVIRQVYQEFGYIIDPHTACGFKEVDPERTSVVLATASPAKFPETIQAAIGVTPSDPSLEALRSRPIVKYPMTPDPRAIQEFIAAHAA